jgi:hypothetical protein
MNSVRDAKVIGNAWVNNLRRGKVMPGDRRKESFPEMALSILVSNAPFPQYLRDDAMVNYLRREKVGERQ